MSETRSACEKCANTELYRRKDFPRAIGIAVIVVAAILVFWTETYWPLAAAALVDLLLFGLLPEVVVCYRCGAEHRGVRFEPRPAIFDIAVADRHKFGAAYKGPRSTNE